jgi:CheY-like chemotaxis protein/REP element-mobilizing transposase RayT
MAKSILAASPDISFGETLRTGLQDAGGFTVDLATSGAEVLACIGNLAFDVAILDSLISDLPLPALVDAIRLKHPDVKVLVIPPTDPFSALTLEECGADNFINKPVFIPELLDLIRGLLKGASPASAATGGTPFEGERPRDMRDIMGEELAKIDWDSNNLPGGSGNDFSDTLVLPLEDVIAETQQHISIPNGPKKNTGALQEIPPEQFLMMEELTRWFSESTARSAMLVSGGEVIATSGELDGEVQRKFAREVSERFQASEARELIRYIPPQQGAGNELLFATTVGSGAFLILTYDSETPYASIREQTERLRKRLAESVQPPVKPEEVAQAWVASEVSSAGEESAAVMERSFTEKETPVEDNLPVAAPIEPEPEAFPETHTEVHEGVGEVEPMAEQIPPMTPPTFNIDEDFPLPDLGKTEASTSAEEEYPWLAVGAASAALGGAAAAAGNPAEFPWETPSELQNDEPVTENLNAPVEPKMEEQPALDLFFDESTLDEEQKPTRITTAELPATATPQGGTSNLRIFLLVPADPRVFLTGKLASELGNWIPQVCQSMSWEVDALAVRPESVRVGLVADPDQKDDIIVGTLQDATARLVAANYPQMALDPEKPLFWADDFLRINPSDPPDQNELNAFIRHLRR